MTITTHQREQLAKATAGPVGIDGVEYVVEASVGVFTGRLGVARRNGERWTVRFGSDLVFDGIEREAFNILFRVDAIRDLLTVTDRIEKPR